MSKNFPPWIVRKVSLASDDGRRDRLESILRRLNLHTVCEQARCPNLWECFSESIATFLILGAICTRNCRFCSVAKGIPLPVDEKEPGKLALAVEEMHLQHAVITSVTRDDLEDGGSSHFFSTIMEVRSINPQVVIEVLLPDFGGKRSAIEKVVEAKPDIIGHNLETVGSLYSQVRPKASYSRSIELLRLVKALDGDIYTKSGLMLGLGEEKEEILSVMEDLRMIDCDILTMGQYLRPNGSCLEVRRFVPPNEFDEYGKVAKDMGFPFVASGPFVRSSYKAIEFSNRFIFGKGGG